MILTLKKAFLAAILLLCLGEYTKAQELTFAYDAAGNQTERKWMCVNCTPFAPASAPASAKSDYLAEARKSNSIKTENEQKLLAYPNPLTETLNIKWPNLKTGVTSIEVYSITGVSYFKKNYKYVEEEFHEMIQFTQMTAGMYVVKVTFTDGKQELLKVVKQ